MTKDLSTAMYTRYVLQLRFNLLLGELMIGLLLFGSGKGQASSPPLPQQLYLLAGTTTQHSDESYPVRLYRANRERKLELAREVVPKVEGIRSVYAWGDAIFALHPHSAPNSAAIIHTNDPMRVDDVVFSRQGVVTSPSATVVAAHPGSALVLLTPWITNLIDPASPPAHIQVTDARISSSSESGSRIQFDTWADYAYLRHEGATGGPNYVAALIGSTDGNNLVMDIFGHSIVVDKLPPNLGATATKIVPAIVAASERYLILTRQHTREEVSAGKLGDSTELSIHDRLEDRWGTIQADGNSSTLRLFGSWLTAIVGTWSPNHPMPNPGRENERTEEKKTDLLPPAQNLYRSFVGHNVVFPGILTLQNLADGRKIRIETGQEDSEVLRVENDAVLYRVNDAIYQARIEGNQLKDTAVVVKDEDVPEIHWVFWSK